MDPEVTFGSLCPSCSVTYGTGSPTPTTPGEGAAGGVRRQRFGQHGASSTVAPTTLPRGRPASPLPPPPDTENPAGAGLYCQAAEGTRTLDLLHGKQTL